jgi:hypothetical protein
VRVPRYGRRLAVTTLIAAVTALLPATSASAADDDSTQGWLFHVVGERLDDVGAVRAAVLPVRDPQRQPEHLVGLLRVVRDRRVVLPQVQRRDLGR